MNHNDRSDRPDPMEELTELSIPLDPAMTSQDVLLCVNGETVRVKRGATVRVKEKFAQVWRQSVDQRMAARQVMERAQEGGRAPAMEL